MLAIQKMTLQLTEDPVFTQIIGRPALASQPSLSFSFRRFDPTSIEQVEQANQEPLNKVRNFKDSKVLILEDTYGHEEPTAYNAQYGTVGFHPLVAFDGVTSDFLKVKLRPGNVYTINGIIEFIQRLIEHYNGKFAETVVFPSSFI